MAWRTLACALAALLLAGCGGKAPDVMPDALEAPWEEHRACTQVAIGVPIPLAEAQQALPDGFQARRLQDGVELALLLLTAMECESAPGGAHDESLVLLEVEPPAGNDAPPGVRHYYEVARATSDDLDAQAFDAMDWRRVGDSVEVEVRPGPPLRAQGLARHDGEILHDLAVDPGVTAQAQAQEIRLWHRSDRGEARVEAFVTEPERSDGPARCRLAAGSDAARVLGATQCPPTARGTLSRDLSYRARLVWDPA